MKSITYKYKHVYKHLYAEEGAVFIIAHKMRCKVI